MKKTDRTRVDFGRAAQDRRRTLIELALKHPQPAIDALDLLKDNQFTSIARNIIAGEAVEDIADRIGVSPKRTERMGAKALRIAGLVSLWKAGELPDPFLGRSFELRAD